MTNQQLEAVIAKQEELKITDFLKGKFKYDNYGQYIWLVEPNGNHQKIADIRGWGRIQHFFMDKKGKIDTKKAGEFQDKCGEWVVNALNKALDSELQSLESQEVITTDEDIENWSLGRSKNLAQESLFDRGYLTGLKHGAIAKRDGKIPSKERETKSKKLSIADESGFVHNFYVSDNDNEADDTLLGLDGTENWNE